MLPANIDFETRSTVDLKATGVYPYAAHPSTDVWVLAVAYGDEEPEIWCPQAPELFPTHKQVADRLSCHIFDGGELHAWNASFERQIWNAIMTPRYKFPKPEMDQFICTMAEAAAYGLPQSLDHAAEVLGVDEQKDKEGKALMMRMTRPRSREGAPLVWWTDTDKILRLAEYCRQDIRTERAIGKKIKPLKASERELYLLDQKINDRGVFLDVPLAKSAVKVAEIAMAKANADMVEATGGRVQAVTQVIELTKWVQEQGVPCTSVAKEALTQMLDSEIPADVRRVLEIRQESGKSSVAKVEKMLDYASLDGYIRGVLGFHGASTGRWVSKGPQLHNVSRGTVPGIEYLLDFILNLDIEALELIASPMEILSSALRSLLRAKPGHQLHVADFSAIEARVLAWLAGQADLLQLFREKKDAYKYMAAKVYAITPEEVNKTQRFVGKSCIAEGQLVLTNAGLVKIEDVTIFHRVWDGVEWVSHDGVIFQGERDVIEYGPLTATADHEVFTEGDSAPCAFGEAKSRSLRLVSSGNGRAPERDIQSNWSGSPQNWTRQEACITVQMPSVRDAGMEVQEGPSWKGHSYLQKLFAQFNSSRKTVGASLRRNISAVQQSFAEALSQLWRQGDRVPILFPTGICGVYAEARSTSGLQGPSDRSTEQRWALRTGQSASSYTAGATAEYAADASYHLPRQANAAERVAEPFCSNIGGDALSPTGLSHGGRIHTAREDVDPGQRQGEKLARNQEAPRRARVYDVINAGPRHRFTVSGVLVSNCVLGLGYQMGAAKFVAACKALAGVDISEEFSKEVVTTYRNANQKIVALWKNLNAHALAAVKMQEPPDSVIPVRYYREGDWLFCELPSGRTLKYARPRIVPREMPWTDDEGNPAIRDCIQVQGFNGMTRKWERQYLYGGLLAENITQAVARDLMAEAMVRVENAGYNVILTVHDEVVSEAPDTMGSVTEFESLMCEIPAWATGCPVAAEAWTGLRYKK